MTNFCVPLLTLPPVGKVWGGGHPLPPPTPYTLGALGASILVHSALVLPPFCFKKALMTVSTDNCCHEMTIMVREHIGQL